MILKICVKEETDRFLELVKSDNKVLFIYIADIDLERIQEQEKQYKYLLDLEEYFIQNYSNLKFKILSIQNIKRENTNNIINLYNKGCEIENKKYGTNYDDAILNLFKYLFDDVAKTSLNKLFE